MSLQPLFNSHGCDKSKKHQYHLFYDQLFEKYPGPIKVLEIGVFKGDSTAAFIEYRPESEFYGADIFERVPIDEVYNRVNHKAKFAKCDSMSSKEVISAMRALNCGYNTFDIIIDDGAHWPEANRLTLNNFFPYLKSGGTYVIEDVWPFHKMSLKELEHPWLKKHPDRYDQLQYALFTNTVETLQDQQGVEVHHFDLRAKTREPDSYIMSLKKL